MKTKTVLSVDVTRDHINDAIKGEAKKCAIARAIVESDPDIVHANVTTDYIKVARYSTERVTTYHTPRLARNFVIAFDTQRKPRPFMLVVTDDSFVSEHPRQMRQRQKAIEIIQRKSVAVATGRKLRDVKPDELEEKTFDSEGWAITKKLPWERVIRPKKARTEIKRPYARRETAAETFSAIPTE